jgi:hypothetical protein
VTKLLKDENGYYADLTQLPTDADLASELRVVNTRNGADLASLWRLVVDFGDFGDWGRCASVWLDAGFAGARGALIWNEDERTFIPAESAHRLSNGHDWLPYYDWAGVECSVRGAASVPVEQAFEAVQEVVATRRRPESIDWVEIDTDRVRPTGPRIQTRHSSTFHRIA